jgi:hypothetical protein
MSSSLFTRRIKMLPNDKRFLKGVRLILVGIILILMAWQICGDDGAPSSPEPTGFENPSPEAA